MNELILKNYSTGFCCSQGAPNLVISPSSNSTIRLLEGVRGSCAEISEFFSLHSAAVAEYARLMLIPSSSYERERTITRCSCSGQHLVVQ